MDFEEFSKQIIAINKDLFGCDDANLGALVRANIEDDQKSILIININPSDAADGKNTIEKRPSCVPHPLVYIPETDKNAQLIKRFSNKSLIWQSFYKKAYELVADRVKMFWATDDYKIEVSKGYPENMEQWKCCYNSEKNNGNDFSLVFADLFYHCNKNQDEVENILKSKNAEESVESIIGIYIKYYKPKIIIVTNKKASELIFKGELATDEITIPNTNIKCLFSSMLSGAGSIDRASYFRLKRRVNEILVK